MLDKNQEEFRVTEAVLDRPTLEGLYRLIQKKVIDKIMGTIKAGKEAHIFWATSPEGKELAVKIYYTSTAEFRRGMLKYIEGDPRFKRIRRDPRGLIYTWTQKEFNNLQLAEEAEVNSPRPIDFLRNILVMSFIGIDGVPAPVLKEIKIEDPSNFYMLLLNELRRLYQKAGLVHGDLSEYNIMVLENKPVIFDLSQAMLTIHPIAPQLLSRDLGNINYYFKRQGVEIRATEKVEEWIKTGKEEYY